MIIDTFIRLILEKNLLGPLFILKETEFKSSTHYAHTQLFFNIQYVVKTYDTCHIIMSLFPVRYDLNKNALLIIRMNISCKEAVAVKWQYLTTLLSSGMCSVSPAAHMIKHTYR